MTLPQRKPLRMQGFDYSRAGAYFVTVVAKDRENLFGAVEDGAVQLNATGTAVLNAWNGLGERFTDIRLDVFVVMPNHFHGLFSIEGLVSGWAPRDVEGALEMRVTQDLRAGRARPLRSRGEVTLPDVMRVFKSISTVTANKIENTPGRIIWQRNYFERVIRDHIGWQRMARYIEMNPTNWAQDRQNVARQSPNLNVSVGAGLARPANPRGPAMDTMAINQK